jgi:acyl-CoA synthetase (AMP-forming)/AMP-acid ligase II
MGLDYVNEVMVVPVEDEEFGERVAAAMVLRVALFQFDGLNCANFP